MQAPPLFTHPSGQPTRTGVVVRLLVRRRLALGLLATAAVFGLSSLPVGVPSRIPNLDKVVHVVEFLLAGLAYLNLATAGFRRFTARALVLYVAVLAGVGVCDELYQSFVPGRVSDWRDLVADGVGGLMALGLGLIAWRWVQAAATRNALPDWWQEPEPSRLPV